MIETFITSLMLGTTTPKEPTKTPIRDDNYCVLVKETRGTKPNRFIKIGI